MWQGLRDYWLPWLLFVGAMSIAAGLLVLIAVMPFVAEHFQIRMKLLLLFAEDAVVRRSSIVGAIGLIVTALVFFRPNPPANARQDSPEKPPTDTMAGA